MVFKSERIETAKIFHPHIKNRTAVMTVIDQVAIIGGAIILSPNALRILDELHIYPRIRHLGHESETVLFRTEDDPLVDSYEIGNEEKYGYKAYGYTDTRSSTSYWPRWQNGRSPCTMGRSSRAYAPSPKAT